MANTTESRVMKFLIPTKVAQALFVALLASAGAAQAAQASYTYSGPNFTRIGSAALGSHFAGSFTFASDFDYANGSTQTKGFADLLSWQLTSGTTNIGSASAGQLSILQTNFTFNHGVINAWLLTGASGDTRYRFQTQGTATGTFEYFADFSLGVQNDTVTAGSFGNFARVGAVPEPASVALMLGGLALLAGALRKRVARPQIPAYHW